MAVHGHGRAGAAVATAVAGGLALGLLVLSGCGERDGADGAADGRGGRAAGGGRVQPVSLGGFRGTAVDPVRALEVVRRAAGTLADAGGAQVRTAMETVSGGTRLTIRGLGTYDFARPVGRLTVLLPEGEAGRAGHRPITEVFVPGALYMKNRGAGVLADKWVRLETGALPDGNLLTSGATDPLAAAELLAGAREVAYAGEDRLRGVRVAHYWGTIDLERAARQAPARDRAPLAAAAKGFSSGMVAFDAYLDEAGRPRLVRYRFGVGPAVAASAAPSGPPPSMTVESVVELFGFGPRPVIELPAPGEIYAGTVASPQK
ncbi:lipoprotein [Streptomyces mashuensis]|uniref:Lipoprotein n=1 Tax=Streptomyces mashuensis TaxID=33904 RepID=A0A919B466_9ACTN|nr:hypothetical protein [Streptomyces mashuensis]GHF45575.1 lipoprotein [Streptomyces mashuensis]